MCQAEREYFSLRPVRVPLDQGVVKGAPLTRLFQRACVAQRVRDVDAPIRHNRVARIVWRVRRGQKVCEVAVCQAVEREVQRCRERAVGRPYAVYSARPRLGERVVPAHQPHVLQDEAGKVQRLIEAERVRAAGRVLATELKL